MFFKSKKSKKMLWTVDKKDVGEGKPFSIEDLKEFSKKNQTSIVIRNTCLIRDGVSIPIH